MQNRFHSLPKTCIFIKKTQIEDESQSYQSRKKTRNKGKNLKVETKISNSIHLKSSSSTGLRNVNSMASTSSFDNTKIIISNKTDMRNGEKEYEKNLSEGILYTELDAKKSEINGNLLFFKGKVNSLANNGKISDSSKLFCIDRKKDLIVSLHSGKHVSKPTDLNFTNLNAIPFVNEQQVSNSPIKIDVESNHKMEVSTNEFNNEIILLPLIYGHSHENDIPSYISPDSNSFTFGTNKIESISNFRPLNLYNNVRYNTNDSNSTAYHLSHGDLAFSINNTNYFYETTTTTMREHESETKLSKVSIPSSNSTKEYHLSKTNFDSHQWHFSNHEEEDEPHDYSYNSSSILLLNKPFETEANSDVESFIKNAPKHNHFNENESSYEERRKHAMILLNIPGKICFYFY